ncbi:DUF6166 domain-containing protein [Rubricoccus marinus]|uniref:Uncharacterized protein n=1 Tax=Rubricoccus marinus TaxID=716817 RepID=A0A259TXU7_9BACT|nr:DUF6166 domain-containing protein [Rubricoccus marinus]OZC02398.1 hypothetical protein BSZ36_05060 [Rubricoccus marinus]
MSKNTKIDGQHAIVNTASVSSTTDPRVPQPDLHARRMAREAEAWLAFARERGRMAEHTLVRKALGATAFSVRHDARSLAVPSKLVGTAQHQRRLWRLVSDGVEPWAELDLDAHGPLVASLGGEPLGEVQAKHAAWARPLVTFGLRVLVARVTGHETEGYRLGCNVVLAGVGEALARLRDALGTGGDGAASGVTASGVTASGVTASGDGHPGAVALHAPLRLVVPRPGTSHPGSPAPTPAASDPATPDPLDTVLVRAVDGSVRATCHHVRRHADALDWGRLGAGPADLALSVLTRVCGARVAEAHYGAFADAVVAAIPRAGGVVRAADVRAWVAARDVPPAA